jgi:hypothetical protein
MSDVPGIAEILVSQLGTPRDHAAEWLGAGVLLLVLAAWVAVELGLARLVKAGWRAIIAKRRDSEGEPAAPLNPPPKDP